MGPKVILIFCAFGAELRSLRTLLSDAKPLTGPDLRGFQGRAGGSDAALIATGIGVRRAQQAAALALGHFYSTNRIIITGVAGALDATLPIGRVVLADRLMVRRGNEFAAETEIEAPRAHREPFAAALDAARITFAVGPFLTSRRALARVADKRRAYEALGAIAVDMESAVVALESAKRDLPFVCIRTIMDTAVDEIEGAYLADEDGRVKHLAVAAALMTKPRLVIASMKLMRNLRAATRSMTEAIAAVLRTNASSRTR
jgi:adenosylhomocysteine nucleosidase